MARRKLPNKYWQAIVWIAANDDTTFLETEQQPPAASVTLHLVADLWNVSTDEAIAHLRVAVRQRREGLAT